VSLIVEVLGKSILQSFKDSSKKPPEWLIDYLK